MTKSANGKDNTHCGACGAILFPIPSLQRPLKKTCINASCPGNAASPRGVVAALEKDKITLLEDLVTAQAQQIKALETALANAKSCLSGEGRHLRKAAQAVRYAKIQINRHLVEGE